MKSIDLKYLNRSQAETSKQLIIALTLKKKEVLDKKLELSFNDDFGYDNFIEIDLWISY